ncbi:MAG: S-methyl-5-thioribose-1-phosphate isomerase [Candidatus Marsarchaeota archaeon]|jgi:methylthioribose-1-phosphate isomerase|nr:S-methyl-5-thioribose-1-phosphate isomerase [Candidatus Marsarchaeota archaeon]
MRNIISMEPVKWNNGEIEWILQNRIPWEETWKKSSSIEELSNGIETLEIRGAPVIGIAAAFGMALSAFNYNGNDPEEMILFIDRDKQRLAKTRPTAVNLFWALEIMSEYAKELMKGGFEVDEIRKRMLDKAIEIQQKNSENSRRMGKIGKDLIKDGDVVMTHCNAGPLACGGIGTSAGVILSAWGEGRDFSVIATHTAPLYQGARLTVWEFMKIGVPVKLISDNMAAYAMRNEHVTNVFLGADRILLDGNVANKIGTYQLAILAKYHNIPFYVVAPKSTIDITGKTIPIEHRNQEEVKNILGKLRISVQNVPTINPAFDITPPELITGIITEEGIARTPYNESLKKFMQKTNE